MDGTVSWFGFLDWTKMERKRQANYWYFIFFCILAYWDVSSQTPTVTDKSWLHRLAFPTMRDFITWTVSLESFLLGIVSQRWERELMKWSKYPFWVLRNAMWFSVDSRLLWVNHLTLFLVNTALWVYAGRNLLRYLMKLLVN